MTSCSGNFFAKFKNVETVYKTLLYHEIGIFSKTAIYTRESFCATFTVGVLHIRCLPGYAA